MCPLLFFLCHGEMLASIIVLPSVDSQLRLWKEGFHSEPVGVRSMYDVCCMEITPLTVGVNYHRINHFIPRF